MQCGISNFKGIRKSGSTGVTAGVVAACQNNVLLLWHVIPDHNNMAFD